jgi:hypothetical protein
MRDSISAPARISPEEVIYSFVFYFIFPNADGVQSKI